MIKAITLDYWDTIFKMENEFNPRDYRLEKMKTMLHDYKSDWSDELLLGLYREVWMKFEQEWKENHRTMTSLEIVQCILSKLEVSISKERFDTLVKYFEEAILLNPPELMDNFRDAIEYMAKNYKLGIISDTGFTPGHVLRQILDNNDLSKYFSVYIFSDEFGRSKPNESTFLSALNQFNVRPEEAVHIGDNERTDICGAYSVGMKSILFTRRSNSEDISSKATRIMKSWKEIPTLLEDI